MSVLSCYREGCEGIMCRRYSHKHGYICNSCFEELCVLGTKQNITEFMQSEKGCNPPQRAVEAFFNLIFEQDENEGLCNW